MSIKFDEYLNPASKEIDFILKTYFYQEEIEKFFNKNKLMDIYYDFLTLAKNENKVYPEPELVYVSEQVKYFENMISNLLTDEDKKEQLWKNFSILKGNDIVDSVKNSSCEDIFFEYFDLDEQGYDSYNEYVTEKGKIFNKDLDYYNINKEIEDIVKVSFDNIIKDNPEYFKNTLLKMFEFGKNETGFYFNISENKVNSHSFEKQIIEILLQQDLVRKHIFNECLKRKLDKDNEINNTIKIDLSDKEKATEFVKTGKIKNRF